MKNATEVAAHLTSEGFVATVSHANPNRIFVQLENPKATVRVDVKSDRYEVLAGSDLLAVTVTPEELVEALDNI